MTTPYEVSKCETHLVRFPKLRHCTFGSDVDPDVNCKNATSEGLGTLWSAASGEIDFVLEVSI